LRSVFSPKEQQALNADPNVIAAFEQVFSQEEAEINAKAFDGIIWKMRAVGPEALLHFVEHMPGAVQAYILSDHRAFVALMGGHEEYKSTPRITRALTLMRDIDRDTQVTALCTDVIATVLKYGDRDDIKRMLDMIEKFEASAQQGALSSVGIRHLFTTRGFGENIQAIEQSWEKTSRFVPQPN
jgi:hypothetical protein